MFTKMPIVLAAVLVLSAVLVWQFVRPTDTLRQRLRHQRRESEWLGPSHRVLPWVDRNTEEETDQGLFDDPDDCSDCIIDPPRMIECDTVGPERAPNETARSWLLVSPMQIQAGYAAGG